MYLAIITLPLLGSIVSGFFGRKVGVSGAQVITCTAVVTTTISAVLAFFEVGLNNIPVSIEVLRWIDSESLNISWAFHFDSLTVSMLIPVLIVSSLVYIYSRGYMKLKPSLYSIPINNHTQLELENSSRLQVFDFVKNKISNLEKFKISLIILAWIIVPVCLEWKIPIFLVLIGITVGAIIILVTLFDKWYLTGSNDFHMIGLNIGQYWSWLEHAIVYSEYNNPFTAVLVIIGFAIIILDLFVIKKAMTIRERLIYIWYNRKVIFIIGLAVMLTVFTINILLWRLGIGMFIDTSSLTLFFYSLFTKVISIKLILTFIKCCIIKKLRVEDVSLSIYTAIFIGILGSINYYLILPLIKIPTSWVVIQLGGIFKDISVWFNKSIKLNDKGLAEGVFRIFTANPFFNWCFPTIHCDSPKQAIKLFNELPFANVNSNDMVEECKTNTNNKSRIYLTEQFNAFRMKMSLFTPRFSVSTESGVENSITKGETSSGQLGKGKKRTLNNMEFSYNKRAKIDLVNTKPSTVTMDDFDFESENWDLHSIYRKIHIIMEDPNYNKRWTISKLFESKEVKTEFYRYIEDSPLTNSKNVWNTTLIGLQSNIGESIKTHYDPDSIKEEDFTDNGLNLATLFKKLSNVMENKDISTRSRIGKLKFEPYTLRKEFYAKLVDLNLNTYKEVSENTISGIKNKIGEKLFAKIPQPHRISWDDFTNDGLEIETIYNKINQYVKEGRYGKRDTISNLFKYQSNIANVFYTRLETLNLTNAKDFSKISSISIETLLNSLEREIDVPFPKDNSITKDDLIDKNWNLHSIYEKILNVTKDKNFDRRDKIGKLVFEPSILRKDFYSYIKPLELTREKTVSSTKILNLKRYLEKELDMAED